MKTNLYLILAILFSSSLLAKISYAQERYKTSSGKVDFTSDAPLELIEASSDQLSGIIEPSSRKYAFSIPITSFQGFVSDLQRQHFNEDYMETEKYPKGTFTGTIQENIDFSQNGKSNITAIGDLTIHGITKKRNLKSILLIEDEEIKIFSSFIILLEDHEIPVPKIVFKKIASEIQIEVNAVLK
ncbi:MAG: YceI family protein [Bacteroidota bacterium]